jgi:hypothetical protein
MAILDAINTGKNLLTNSMKNKSFFAALTFGLWTFAAIRDDFVHR